MSIEELHEYVLTIMQVQVLMRQIPLHPVGPSVDPHVSKSRIQLDLCSSAILRRCRQCTVEPTALASVNCDEPPCEVVVGLPMMLLPFTIVMWRYPNKINLWGCLLLLMVECSEIDSNV